METQLSFKAHILKSPRYSNFILNIDEGTDFPEFVSGIRAAECGQGRRVLVAPARRVDVQKATRAIRPSPGLFCLYSRSVLQIDRKQHVPCGIFQEEIGRKTSGSLLRRKMRGAVTHLYYI